MSHISCRTWMLWYCTQLTSVCLHEASNGLWIINDEIIDVVIVHYVRDILTQSVVTGNSCELYRVLSLSSNSTVYVADALPFT